MSTAGAPTPSRLRRGLPAIVVAAAAAALLFARLDARYLWQDEAACALMSERLLEHGRPLAYDGRNLITMDEFQPHEAQGLSARTRDAETAVAYYVAKGDFKEDTTWIGQPWGQFVATGLSFLAFGRGTFQARLPFALAGVATAIVLFVFARRRFGSTLIAGLAVALLLASTWWVLHVRQCRYYALSTLLGLVTFVAYRRWQERRDGGGFLRPALFVLAAWCSFHADFGSFWPLVGVLGADALIARPRRWPGTLAVFGVLGLSVLPFAVLYELYERHKEPALSWEGRGAILALYTNQYLLPFLLVPPALALVARRAVAEAERRIVALALALLAVQLVFMTAVSPFPFYRYLVGLTPFASLVAAFVLVRGCEAWLPGSARGKRAAALALGLLLLVTPLPSLALRWAVPVPEIVRPIQPRSGTFLREELRVLATELRGTVPDPNRRVVELLRGRLRPGDEVVVNYEDAPLAFYLGVPVRGGISCFRAEAPSPPRFLVLRESVGFTHGAVYRRVFEAWPWRPVPCDAPDLPWGNNPDPWCHYTRQLDHLERSGTVNVYENGGL